jgi:hypothetical protein
MEAPRCHRSHTRRREGRLTRRKLGSRCLRRLGSKGPVGSAREASNSAGCSESEPGSPEISGPPEADGGGLGSAETIGDGRRPVPWRKDWVRTIQGLSGVVEGDMPRQNVLRKLGTTRGPPRPARAGTAKAPPITCRAGKWWRAGEWGRWGRVSVDGLGHYNPDRSEGPWGRVASATRTAVLHRVAVPDSERGKQCTARSTKGGCKRRGATRGRRVGRRHLTGWP